LTEAVYNGTFRKTADNWCSMKKGASIMLRLSTTPRDRRAKDGQVGMSLGIAGAVVAVERMVVGRRERLQSLAAARFAVGDVVCSPAGGPSPRGCAPAGVSDDYQDYYYFLAAVGRKAEFAAYRVGAHLAVCAVAGIV
jgi:hypothetical protein